MDFIDSVNYGYDTDACLHYTWNDIYVTNDSGVHFNFCSSVEVSSPLKVLFSIVDHISFYCCIYHGKLPIPITADLFAPISSVARASSPSYTNSALSVTQFTACLPKTVVCKHCCWETSIEHITMECLVGG